ncbi:putative carboxylesterase [Hyaloscypha variabilis F]|uniref:Carboxylic ester hydrolase n=1 Tax=Hyaloscypha variabilis (strain UAMH 11265 / GT02V1 / F) TaxID=1149755 RepID=A0A2J6RWH1_HYAVF|nr:putative carboxylesterase [Hyaloscypha variabilis F]
MDPRRRGRKNNKACFNTSLTLLFQNNLNYTDDVNHVGFILLDPFTNSEAAAQCAGFGESLVPSSEIKANLADFNASFSYLVYATYTHRVQQYIISDGIVTYDEAAAAITFGAYPSGNPALPVLCTQSSNEDQPTNSYPSPTNQVSIASSGNTYVGYRNQKSFRFLGIPYADPPQRWDYSTLYSPTGQTLNASAYAPICPQTGSGEEFCLYLNIQTPYLPKKGSTANLRPVFFWIHGGGFTSGSAADPGVDGGNLASREDIVVVQIQYRLSTLGFLAIPGTDIKGNYGIADQINALEWIIKNVASFGGDPTQITIGGDSAGAGSVRTLLGSPPAKGKFQGAIAQSNLGGDVDLGQSGGYSTTYASYLTIAASYAIAGRNIFQEAGCNQTSLDAQIACLKAVPAVTLNDFANVARYVVQDGTFVNTEQLDVSNKNGSTAFVPTMFGTCRNDGASIGSTYPTTPVTSEVTGIEASLGISEYFAQDIINSGLFPFYNTGNLTLDAFNVSQRVSTDRGFHCIDQATMYAGAVTGAFAASYYYIQERTIGGYDPNNLGGPPVEPSYPYGDPNLPYFRFHSGATDPFIFGNISPIRDPDDLYAAQLNSGYFAQFVKDGQPNPDQRYLQKRGYTKTLEAVVQTGRWADIRGTEGPIRLLDYPSVESGFLEVPQRIVGDDTGRWHNVKLRSSKI